MKDVPKRQARKGGTLTLFEACKDFPEGGTLVAGWEGHG